LCRRSSAHKVYRVSSYAMHLLQSDVMAVVVNYQLLKTEARIRSLASPFCDFWWTKGHWDKLYSECFDLYGVTLFLEPDLAGCISDFVNFSHVNFTEYQFSLRTFRIGFVVHVAPLTRGFSEYFDFLLLVSVHRYFLSIFIALCF